MKYLLILLFPTILYAAFTSFSTNPTADSITAKGNLLTKTATAQVNFPACPDDEFLIWDDAEDAGMKCSGSNITIAGNLTSANGNLYLGLNKGVATAASIYMFNDGDGVYSAYINQDTADVMRILNKYGGITFYSANTATLQLNGTQGVVIFGTGGNGGNIPHSCARSSITHGAASYIDYTCPANKILTGGGCTLSQPYVNGYPLSSTVYRCTQSVVSAIGAFGICCAY